MINEYGPHQNDLRSLFNLSHLFHNLIVKIFIWPKTFVSCKFIHSHHTQRSQHTFSREDIRIKNQILGRETQGFGTHAHTTHKTNATQQMDYYFIFIILENGEEPFWVAKIPNLTTWTMKCQLMIFCAISSSITHLFSPFESNTWNWFFLEVFAIHK